MVEYYTLREKLASCVNKIYTLQLKNNAIDEVDITGDWGVKRAGGMLVMYLLGVKIMGFGIAIVCLKTTLVCDTVL